MQILETHTVQQQEKPIRLQEYAVGIFETVSTKSALKKAIKKGLILVDGEVCSTAKYIFGGEKIELLVNNHQKQQKLFHFPLKVLFEDDYLAIIYKPAGIVVSGNKFATIANCLNQNLKKSNQIDAVKPKPIHRLDHPTSGVLLIGKTNQAIIKLNNLFKEKQVQKTYFAITIGKMPQSGVINMDVDNKSAITQFELLKTTKSTRFEYLNLVKLHPKTGRKHQLRKHLFSIGNPILGDKEYYLDDKILVGKGLYLFASSLRFLHPITKEKVRLDKKLPKKFRKIFIDF